MASKTGWFPVTIPSEVERLARERCQGYNFNVAKSQEEIMRDCWVQGFIDGSLLYREQVDAALGGGK